jgi:hypothetical protein
MGEQAGRSVKWKYKRIAIDFLSHVIPYTFCCQIATFQSSGLKIQVDGRLCTLFKNWKG